MSTEALHIIENCQNELVFTTSRSGGSGGQHVNKVETKVTLRWSIVNSLILTEEQKQLLLRKLSPYINQMGEMVIYDQSGRSQKTNKDKVIQKWQAYVIKAFVKVKPRKRTRPSKQAILKMKENKRRQSELKASRRKPVL